MVLDLLRIGAYLLISSACAYLYLDDAMRDSSRRFVWLALGVEHAAVLVLLAMDLRSIVEWMETRWILTPFAVIAAIVLCVYVVRRHYEHERMMRVIHSFRWTEQV